MEMFPITERVVRCAVLRDGEALQAVVGSVDVEAEYANGEYAFGVTIAKVWGNPPTGGESFYLITGDLPCGSMISCMCSDYTFVDDKVEVFITRSYDWRENICTWSPQNILLPRLCGSAFDALQQLDVRTARPDDNFDMDVVALLEDCGFWPWDFHFADSTTNFED